MPHHLKRKAQGSKDKRRYLYFETFGEAFLHLQCNLRLSVERVGICNGRIINKVSNSSSAWGVGNLKHLERASTFLQVNLETDHKISVFTLGVQSFKETAAISPE